MSLYKQNLYFVVFIVISIRSFIISIPCIKEGLQSISKKYGKRNLLLITALQNLTYRRIVDMEQKFLNHIIHMFLKNRDNERFLYDHTRKIFGGKQDELNYSLKHSKDTELERNNQLRQFGAKLRVRII